MSLFSPDRRFLFEDLTRLEEVMGVQIVSILASHVSQLASLSGVTPLPEPQSQSEEYVKKLICRPWFCFSYMEASAGGHQWCRSARAEGKD